MMKCFRCEGSEITRTLSPTTLGGKKVFCAEVKCDRCGYARIAYSEAMDVAIDQAADLFEKDPDAKV